VYRKAEILFARLNMVRDRLRPWVALGTLDVEAWVEAHCTQLAHFEANFATIKVRPARDGRGGGFDGFVIAPRSPRPPAAHAGPPPGGGQVARPAQGGLRHRERGAVQDRRGQPVSGGLAPDGVRVERRARAAPAPTVPVAQHAIDALVIAMRRLFLSNLRVVEQFVEGGIDDMAAKPTSLADIAKSQKRWKELCDERPGMKRMAADCDEQRKLLLSMSGGSVDLSDVVARVAKLPALWDAFDSALEAFTGVVEEQRTALKGAFPPSAGGTQLGSLTPPPPRRRSQATSRRR
jgi:hypothetical protein